MAEKIYAVKENKSFGEIPEPTDNYQKGAETLTNKIWLGKPVYRKIVNLGTITSFKNSPIKEFQWRTAAEGTVYAIRYDPANSFMGTIDGTMQPLPMGDYAVVNGNVSGVIVLKYITQTLIGLVGTYEGELQNCCICIEYCKEWPITW